MCKEMTGGQGGRRTSLRKWGQKRRMAERSLLLIVYRVAATWAQFGGNVSDLVRYSSDQI